MASSSAAGESCSATKTRTLALAFMGTRGDCQPYVALMLGLQARGHRVVAFSSGEHRNFVADYGIEFVEFQPERVQVKPDDGSNVEFAKNLFAMPHFKQDLLVFAEELLRLRPELLMAGTLVDEFCWSAGLALGIPVLGVKMQLTYPNRFRIGFGLPSFPACLGWANILARQCVVPLFLNHPHTQQLQRSMAEVLGVRTMTQGRTRISSRAIWDTVLNVPAPYELVALPRVLAEAMYHYVPPNVRLTGYLVVGASLQTGAAGAEHFGGPSVLQDLEAFLAGGEPPVCIGWGSMLSVNSIHMATLACAAAMRARTRAVVVGGWAQLSQEKLQKASAGRPELVAYARRNVFFVAKAPHEWLFPRCACTVHHGGAGTLGAALRAGVPTVITPVFGDQFDHALAVENLGVGVGMKKLKSLSEEDGVAAAVWEIEKLVVLHDLGEFRGYMDCVLDKQRELDAQSSELGPARLALTLATAAAVLRPTVRQLVRLGGRALRSAL